ncbi:MAG: hypothetical protein QHH10_00345 [Peptococcaceae bacterium]|jgi:hypothetical protein|nr:hypothetical protein [Peptococcaceae bacterium]MDH7523754.1 hypothetical protein [Peptococcaceae bacterium]
MKLRDIVSFRKDLLFNGAVQISWFEHDRDLANKAAQHFIFHGPDYHGISEDALESSEHKLVDTASFTLDILKNLFNENEGDPFALAIAGYGTGKSHLGLTLASLLSMPNSTVAKTIINNISSTDARIGQQITKLIESIEQPFLVITLNGMQDFDLGNEIIRQVLSRLNEQGLDSSPLDNLRPRFRTALHFTESFFEPLRQDYVRLFGENINFTDIIDLLKCQDEDAFSKISNIYEQKMGTPIHAVSQESLHDFIRITKETYCGPGKPFAGLFIIFDEFGRYMEFAVQKPHVAGSGALQQLFECIQTNADRVFLLCFIQYELKAYISRVAPELREDVNRYVTRYDSVRKTKLSTNLETLIASLLEKKNLGELKLRLASAGDPQLIQAAMQRWFPDIKNHSLWLNKMKFEKVIWEGCWPLHPLSTWMLYKLSSVGKSLQQRSAFSLLVEICDEYHDMEFTTGKTIVPTDFCNEALISEFLASERYGQQGATASAYESVLYKYKHEFSPDDKRVLKAVLVSAKIGLKTDSKEDYLHAISMFSGIDFDSVAASVKVLELEYGVLEWNGLLNQYEISGEAVPRRNFLSYLKKRVEEIDAQTRSDIFCRNFLKWTNKDKYNTSFAESNKISTREWNYHISYSDVANLKSMIDYAVRTWQDAKEVNDNKGQLIYCYVGPESNLDVIKKMAIELIQSNLKQRGLNWESGIPLAVLFLHDSTGVFGEKVAEYWVLNEQLTDEESQKYGNYILDRKNIVEQEMLNLFSELERDRHILFATPKEIKTGRLSDMLFQLFDIVYYNRIPFPFDGFSTLRGNGPKDCQLFTRELFKGTLNRDWISACNQQQRNRAYDVLDESWGAIDDDGSIRLKPKNPAVRNIIEYLESELNTTCDTDDTKSMNLGEIMRVLCAPPYGCNIASAGLLLGLFIGKRRDIINLFFNNNTISLENWLSEALKGNYLSFSVLDATEVIKVSQKSISEWESLLNDWNMETLLLGKISFLKKAGELEKHLSIPPALYYKYAHLCDEARRAQRKIKEYDEQINTAIEKIERGKEKNDIGSLSWGTADLAELHEKMEVNTAQWHEEQIMEVKTRLENALLHLKRLFLKWLKNQTTYNIEELSKWKYMMINNIGGNLKKLGLHVEYDSLKKHVEYVENNVHFIHDVKTTAADIDKMIRNNIINDLTPIAVLKNWLEQVQVFALRLEEAKKNGHLVEGDLTEASYKLATFQKGCKEQLKKNKERTEKVYRIEKLFSLGEIANWRNEVALLITIYQGENKDIEDLNQVQKQLDLIEKHFAELDNMELNEAQFNATVEKCLNETLEFFADDTPPLDCYSIYEGLKEVISKKRKEIASEWVKRNLPRISEINQYNADIAIQTLERLRKAPQVLSIEQSIIVRDAIKTCEKRLDELEIEGLKVKFFSMSEENKRAFIMEIYDYFKNIIIEDKKMHRGLN